VDVKKRRTVEKRVGAPRAGAPNRVTINAPAELHTRTYYNEKLFSFVFLDFLVLRFT
jgi:hypothetical protein